MSRFGVSGVRHNARHNRAARKNMENKTDVAVVICDLVNCRDCMKLIRQTESWDMPWVFWYECKAKPFVENLRSFPFQNTRCKEFKRREKPLTPSLSEVMRDRR